MKREETVVSAFDEMAPNTVPEEIKPAIDTTPNPVFPEIEPSPEQTSPVDPGDKIDSSTPDNSIGESDKAQEDLSIQVENTQTNQYPTIVQTEEEKRDSSNPEKSGKAEKVKDKEQEKSDSTNQEIEENTAPKPEDKNTNTDESQTKNTESEKQEKPWPKRYNNYATLLKTYVDKQGEVDYFALRRLRRELLEASKDLESVDRDQYEKWTKEEKVAFWINIHNLCTLRLVIDNYPIKPRWPFNLMYPNGIMQIPSARTKVYFQLMEQEYSLSEIERDILLRQFGEPRYLFSLSHATRGAGFLRREPFCAKLLEKQTEEQWRFFLASPRGLKIDKSQHVVHLSDMFIWYKDAIISKYGQIKRFREQPEDIRAYLNFIYDALPKEDTDYLLNNQFSVKFISYDWSLNEQSPN
ncbi:MAG: DUF547 domain-containing protein [Sedimentisphaerales bacterium]|nr:DUF547 domain-containing protein [Sedimentisphaerales bacterium]